MAKRSDLIDGMAAALGQPKPSINVLAMELGRAGLITSGGRGLNAAEMTAADAASLLIAAMAGGYATETATTTALVRSAGCLGGQDPNGKTIWQPPSFIGGGALDQNHQFHEIVEAIIDSFIRLDGLDIGYELGLSRSVTVYIERGAARYYSVVTFGTGTSEWKLAYGKWKPAFSEADPEDLPLLANEANEKHGMVVAVKIGGVQIRKIADCLRGRPFQVPGSQEEGV